MSFGFSIGDFIAVTELANKIRKEFIDAPSQFKAISDEVRSLSIVLLDVEVVLSDRELCTEQEVELKQIAHGCRNILDQLEHTLYEYSELKSGYGSVRERVKRVWKRLKWEPEDIKQLRSRMSTNIGLLNAFIGRLTRDNVITLVRRQEDQGRQTILDWITPIDYALQQSDFINRRQAGTGQWLLSSAEFKAWAETDKRTLFCPGIPGAGKTILTSIVIEELFTRFENDGDIGIAYLYCNYQRQHEQNPTDLFASLLKQFIQEQPSIPDRVQALYDRHKDKRTRPSLDEILQILQTVIAGYSRVFIIVDALDECQISDGYRQRFLLGLATLQAKCRINLFATSRPISSIEKEFKGNSKLEVRASKEDVRRYLDGHMSQLPGFVNRSSELQDEIKKNIIRAVDGMFLLAQLHLESLTGKRSPRAIQVALKNLAIGSGAYDHAYKDAMERINGQIKDQKELAKQVLSWITCAMRPLTTLELQHALAIEIGDSQLDEENIPEVEDIMSVCAGLVTVDIESGIIRLVHYTTQEYFNRTWEKWFPSAQTNITTICVTYLSFHQFEGGSCQNDEEFEQRLQLNKLYDYAAHNWGHHARKASMLIPEVVSFLKRKVQLEASSQGLLAQKTYSSDREYSQKFLKDMTGLHLAAFFGAGAVVKLLLEKGADIAAATSDGSTPLHWASKNGHIEVVQLLLEKGADVTAATNNGSTPLHWASLNGYIEVVQLLLEKGADVTAATSNGSIPFNEASFSGYIEVIQLLLKKGADVTAATSDGSTPLHWASLNGHIKVVQLLLEKGADVTAATSDGSTPLHWASFSGYIEVVQLLLEKGANVTAATSKGSTPLHEASFSGYIEVVQLLLEKGADVTAATSDGSTPLHWASLNGHIEVVQLLLEKGADVTAATSDGSTPLHWASFSGYIEVVQLLLEKGADVTAATSKGSTPLHWASLNGHIEVVQLLLEKGPDLTAATSNGSTPLHEASKNGQGVVVKLLLAIDSIKLDSRDRIGRTPLFYEVRNGNTATVQLMLDTNRVDFDSKDVYNSTPLSIAVRMGHQDVVAILLTKNLVLNFRDNFGRTPLWWARRTGNIHIANLLLEKYKEKGIIIREDNVPPTLSLASADNWIKICDVCSLYISAKDACYHCQVCNDGDFDICEECFLMKACCLNQDHVLVKEINRVRV